MKLREEVQSLGEYWRRRMSIIACDEASEVPEHARRALKRMIARDVLIESEGR